MEIHDQFSRSNDKIERVLSAIWTQTTRHADMATSNIKYDMMNAHSHEQRQPSNEHPDGCFELTHYYSARRSYWLTVLTNEM